MIQGENFDENVQLGIIDNEFEATLPIVDIDFAVVSEGDGVAVHVTLDRPAIGDVTVGATADLGAAAGADYETVFGTITIPEGQTPFKSKFPSLTTT